MIVWVNTASVLSMLWALSALSDWLTAPTGSSFEPYRKIDRMQVLYSFSLVEMDILDFQIWLCKFCIDSRKSNGVAT